MSRRRIDYGLVVAWTIGIVYVFMGALSWGIWSGQNWPACNDCEGGTTIAHALGAIIWPVVWVIRLGAWVAS